MKLNTSSGKVKHSAPRAATSSKESLEGPSAMFDAEFTLETHGTNCKRCSRSKYKYTKDLEVWFVDPALINDTSFLIRLPVLHQSRLPFQMNHHLPRSHQWRSARTTSGFPKVTFRGIPNKRCFFSVQRQMALARSFNKPERQLHCANSPN